MAGKTIVVSTKFGTASQRLSRSVWLRKKTERILGKDAESSEVNYWCWKKGLGDRRPQELKGKAGDLKPSLLPPSLNCQESIYSSIMIWCKEFLF